MVCYLMEEFEILEYIFDFSGISGLLLAQLPHIADEVTMHPVLLTNGLEKQAE